MGEFRRDKRIFSAEVGLKSTFWIHVSGFL